MKRNRPWVLLVGFGGVALSGFTSIHSSEAATMPARPEYRAPSASLLLVDGEVVLPSQRLWSPRPDPPFAGSDVDEHVGVKNTGHSARLDRT
jgi:hypothetical protein